MIMLLKNICGNQKTKHTPIDSYKILLNKYADKLV